MKRILVLTLALLLLFTAVPAFSFAAAAETPTADSAYANTLFLVGGTAGAYTLQNVKTGKYLTCDGNATLGDSATPFTVTAITGGVKIALAEATGGKSAGSSLHFGSYNRLSFGDATAFAVYEYAGNGEFTVSESIEAGKYYLFAYISGTTKYAVSGTPYGSGTGSRIETEEVAISLASGETEESPYKGLLYLAGGSVDALTFKNVENGLYLADGGNASLGETPVTFSAEKVEGGFYINRTNYTGDHAALHLGSNNRVSYGTASTFAVYEYIVHNDEELFGEIESVVPGKAYIIIYKSGSSMYALTGSTYNSGSSSRIETQATSITLYNADKVAFENSAYLPYLYKIEESEGGYTFRHIESAAYITCDGNATLKDTPALLTVVPSGDGVKIALAQATGGKAAGDALHKGTGYKMSFGDASTMHLYEYVENEKFAEVTQILSGGYYLVVYNSSGTLYALTGVVDSGPRITTETVSVEQYVCGTHSVISTIEKCTFTAAGSTTEVCRYCGSTSETQIPAAQLGIYPTAILGEKDGQPAASMVCMISEKELDLTSVDYLLVTLSYEKDGSTRTVRQVVRTVYTTVTGVASVNADTAAAGGLACIDAAYIVALRLVGVPAGERTVALTLEAMYGGQSIAQCAADLTFVI